MTYEQFASKLHKTKEYKKMAKHRHISSPMPLYYLMTEEEMQADIMCNSLRCDDKRELAFLLIELDYATYIPFGKRGKKIIENLIEEKENQFNRTYLSYRAVKKDNIYGLFATIKVKVDENLKKSIDKFFDYMDSDKQDFSDIESVAATIRRIGGELDNQTSKSKYYGDDQRFEQMEKILDKIWTHIKTHNTKCFDIKEFLKETKADKPLSPTERLFFKYITSIRLPKEQKEEKLEQLTLK